MMEPSLSRSCCGQFPHLINNKLDLPHVVVALNRFVQNLAAATALGTIAFDRSNLKEQGGSLAATATAARLGRLAQPV